MLIKTREGLALRFTGRTGRGDVRNEVASQQLGLLRCDTRAHSLERAIDGQFKVRYLPLRQTPHKPYIVPHNSFLNCNDPCLGDEEAMKIQ